MFTEQTPLIKGLLQAFHRLAAGYVRGLKRINGPDGPRDGGADGDRRGSSDRGGASGPAYKPDTYARQTTSWKRSCRKLSCPAGSVKGSSLACDSGATKRLSSTMPHADGRGPEGADHRSVAAPKLHILVVNQMHIQQMFRLLRAH